MLSKVCLCVIELSPGSQWQWHKYTFNSRSWCCKTKLCTSVIHQIKFHIPVGEHKKELLSQEYVIKEISMLKRSKYYSKGKFTSIISMQTFEFLLSLLTVIIGIELHRSLKFFLQSMQFPLSLFSGLWNVLTHYPQNLQLLQSVPSIDFQDLKIYIVLYIILTIMSKQNKTELPFLPSFLLFFVLLRLFNGPHFQKFWRFNAAPVLH